MRAHVTAVVRACFAISEKYEAYDTAYSTVARPAVVTMIRALVLSKMDYCNSVLDWCSWIAHTASSVCHVPVFYQDISRGDFSSIVSSPP